MRRSDGTARLFVEEASPISAVRTLLQLRNKGNARMSFSADGGLSEWLFLSAPGSFVINYSGHAGLELSLFANGSMTIPGAMTALSFNPVSDRNLKENLVAVDVDETLKKVAKLPISSWSRKGENTRHVGPTAQDFYAVFGMGKDDRHLSLTDTAGVALAAIQGLYQGLQERDAEIARLKARLAERESLKAELAEIRSMLGDR